MILFVRLVLCEPLFAEGLFLEEFREFIIYKFQDF